MYIQNYVIALFGEASFRGCKPLITAWQISYDYRKSKLRDLNPGDVDQVGAALRTSAPFAKAYEPAGVTTADLPPSPPLAPSSSGLTP
jgi:hypothetical protein